MNEVRFYRASEKPYGAFSNLYRREIEFEGERFATSEHAYQAGKARKPEVRRWLMAAPSPALLAMAVFAAYAGETHGDYYLPIVGLLHRTQRNVLDRTEMKDFAKPVL